MMSSLLVVAAALAAQSLPPATVSSGTAIRAEANGALEGYLLQPAGRPRATMITVPGSGPTDRDGNNPAGVKVAPFASLPRRCLPKVSRRFGSTSAACSAARAPQSERGHLRRL